MAPRPCRYLYSGLQRARIVSLVAFDSGPLSQSMLAFDNNGHYEEALLELCQKILQHGKKATFSVRKWLEETSAPALARLDAMDFDVPDSSLVNVSSKKKNRCIVL